MLAKNWPASSIWTDIAGFDMAKLRIELKLPGGKSVAEGVLNVDDIEWTRMTFSVDDGSDSPQVTTARDHAQVSRVKLDEVHNFVGGDIQLDGIVNLDQGVGVTDGATIVCCDEGDTFGSNLNATNFAKLVLKIEIKRWMLCPTDF